MRVKLERVSGGLLQATVTGECSKFNDLKEKIFDKSFPFLDQEDFYLEHNGKILRDDEQIAALFAKQDEVKTIRIAPRLLGGKGGFGSMLRAIGAQIEKTTNRDACRDLSGRRLRDINEEQRLKKWFAKQAEREKEKQEARKRKLDKLRQVADGPPLPKIDDQEFLQQREDIVEAVFEAVDEAFREGTEDIDALAIHNDSSNSQSPNHEATLAADSIEGDSKPAEASSSTESVMSTTSTASSSGMSGMSTSSSASSSRQVKRTMFDEDLDTETESSSEDEDEVESEPSPKKAKLP